MSTVYSKNTLLPISSDSLTRWPLIHADISVSTSHVANTSFFHDINIEYLCLAGLGMASCDLHFGPQNSFDHIQISRVVCDHPLDMYGWIDIADIGLVHLTRRLDIGNNHLAVFQGWRLESTDAATIVHRAKFKPCILYFPCRAFSDKKMPKPPRQVSRFKTLIRAIRRFG
ncbi:hypothetical protein FOMPIDRAFT_94876 [Fomitopsis schrenkii]|uniref:Uncharacterized protein n=1 Tax=Fomitopsis schrenkii TaxID=2126942 RepID=S8DHA8_FOMSC|nr:hypothetical protein FOMPIDRAFT_94876 [Fomitopsis schrenkii]